MIFLLDGGGEGEAPPAPHLRLYVITHEMKSQLMPNIQP